MTLCDLCGLDIPRYVLIRHKGLIHKYDRNFSVTCDVPDCGKTFRKWYSFRRHLQLKHNIQIQDLEQAERGEDHDDHGLGEHNDVDENFDVRDAVNNLDLGEDMHEDPMTPSEKLRYHCALFVGHLKEKLLIPQSTVEHIIEGTSLLFGDYLQVLKDQLLSGEEPVENVPANLIRDVFRNAEPSEIFSSCKSSHQMNSFMSANLGLVEPVKTQIGQKRMWTAGGRIRTVPFYGYVVPFLESLQLCLSNRDVMHCVENPKEYMEGLLRTATDGRYYRNHRIFLLDNKSLAIMIYYDDVEFTNPIGSKTHKLAMFYWVLLNIYPEFRSSYRVHNLLAVTTSSNLKHFGAGSLLGDFIDGMQKLGSPEGVTLKINGVNRVFHGLLNVVAGDTPASGLLGGFKEGVSKAKRPCRRCMISREDFKTNFNVFSFELRDLVSHNNQLNNLLHPNLTPQARTFWSKQYGINYKSCLLDMEFTDITQCMPHDFHHVVLEGTLSYHLLYFLNYCINEKKFTVPELNLAIYNFNYDCLQKDKPSPIDEKHLKNKSLRQGAAQMLTLGQTLPFIIGRWLDETDSEHLQTFILLMQIINMALAFELYAEDAGQLCQMIRTHHIRFKRLYGTDGITQKWHYMLHLPEQILLFGNARQTWVMRCEAQHSYFKNVACRNKNFRNLPYTFATRKQETPMS